MATSAPHQYIARPRVIVEPVDPTDRHTLYRARCEHCPWISSKSVKTWVDGTEARLHRIAHRAGTAPVCHLSIVLTESGQDWTWQCACGASTERGWHGYPFELSAADAALDALGHGHRGEPTFQSNVSPKVRERFNSGRIRTTARHLTATQAGA
ncbi:hypothetical protein [Cellulosimicrobium cellulans]|uniref:hypothetical protein n=1 Tax=Cellulosimicrobium cellulans TaxID=1710 RepID=UPI000317DFCB|nr:hypothetical protein [Cellulosimicrobium cellulans]